MPARRLIVAAAVLLASCTSPMGSNWHLMDEGYSINPVNAHEFAVEVHVNQLRQLGGDVASPVFRSFVAERLKWHDLCPAGWTPAACVEDGSCVQHTRRSVTVTGRCAP